MGNFLRIYMAYLTDVQHDEVREEWASDLSERLEEMGLNKADQKAMVVALDAYTEDNAVTINNTLPEPGRTVATKSQKAEVFMLVLAKRYKVDA